MRRYRGFISDSDRWTRFAFRPGDIVISTPSKAGTTWMQTIVAMLVFGGAELPDQLAVISPWLDMSIRTDEEVFGLLESQHHRRFVKTHTPLDGLPLRSDVTYLCVVRHPLDIALSNRDHRDNMDYERVGELRRRVAGAWDPSDSDVVDQPADPVEYLRWWIDNDLPSVGSGPYGLADYCSQVCTYWEARHTPTVHLFHYADLSADLEGEMRRVAAALHLAVDERVWPEMVAAAGFEAMRSRASTHVPEAHLDLWRSPPRFFAVGGTRAWAGLLSEAELRRFHRRLRHLAGDATEWILEGRAALRRSGRSRGR